MICRSTLQAVGCKGYLSSANLLICSLVNGFIFLNVFKKGSLVETKERKIYNQNYAHEIIC